MKSLPEVECLSEEWYSGYLAVIFPVLTIYLVMPMVLFGYLKGLGYDYIWDGSTLEYR